MGQELNGSLGSWVTLSDPFPALISCVTIDTQRANNAGAYLETKRARTLLNWANIGPPHRAWITSGELFLSTSNMVKPLDCLGCDPNPAGELTAFPRHPSWWRGAGAPPQELYPCKAGSTLRVHKPYITYSIWYDFFLHFVFLCRNTWAKSALDSAAREVLGPRLSAKKPWFSQATLYIIDQRRKKSKGEI